MTQQDFGQQETNFKSIYRQQQHQQQQQQQQHQQQQQQQQNNQQQPMRRVQTHKLITPSGNLRNYTFRTYDAVGPETITILELLARFARYQGNNSFRPVHIGYRNMERILNIKSLGNLNRQFLSLLRSEQDAACPVIGNPSTWEKLLGSDAKLTSLEEAFRDPKSDGESPFVSRPRRKLPVAAGLKLIYNHPKVVFPAAALMLETLKNYMNQRSV